MNGPYHKGWLLQQKDSPILIAGRSGDAHTWKKRYYTLKDDMLFVYYQPQDQQPHHEFSLRNATLRVNDPRDKKNKGVKSSAFIFSLTLPGKSSSHTYYFQAAFQEEMDEWVRALSYGIDWANNKAGENTISARNPAALVKRKDFTGKSLNPNVNGVNNDNNNNNNNINSNEYLSNHFLDRYNLPNYLTNQQLVPFAPSYYKQQGWNHTINSDQGLTLWRTNQSLMANTNSFNPLYTFTSKSTATRKNPTPNINVSAHHNKYDCVLLAGGMGANYIDLINIQQTSTLQPTDVDYEYHNTMSEFELIDDPDASPKNNTNQQQQKQRRNDSLDEYNDSTDDDDDDDSDSDDDNGRKSKIKPGLGGRSRPIIADGNSDNSNINNPNNNNNNKTPQGKPLFSTSFRGFRQIDLYNTATWSQQYNDLFLNYPTPAVQISPQQNVKIPTPQAIQNNLQRKIEHNRPDYFKKSPALTSMAVGVTWVNDIFVVGTTDEVMHIYRAPIIERNSTNNSGSNSNNLVNDQNDNNKNNITKDIIGTTTANQNTNNNNNNTIGNFLSGESIEQHIYAGGYTVDLEISKPQYQHTLLNPYIKSANTFPLTSDYVDYGLSSLSICPVQPNLLTSLAYSTISLFELDNPTPLIVTECVSSVPITSHAWSYNKTPLLALGGARGGLKIFDARIFPKDGEKSIRFLNKTSITNSIIAIANSPLLPTLWATCTINGNIAIWDERYPISPLLEFPAPSTCVSTLKWSNSHIDWLHVGFLDGTVSNFNLRTPPYFHAHSANVSESSILLCSPSHTVPMSCVTVDQKGKTGFLHYRPAFVDKFVWGGKPPEMFDVKESTTRAVLPNRLSNLTPRIDLNKAAPSLTASMGGNGNAIDTTTAQISARQKLSIGVGAKENNKIDATSAAAALLTTEEEEQREDAWLQPYLSPQNNITDDNTTSTPGGGSSSSSSGGGSNTTLPIGNSNTTLSTTTAATTTSLLSSTVVPTTSTTNVGSSSSTTTLTQSNDNKNDIDDGRVSKAVRQAAYERIRQNGDTIRKDLFLRISRHAERLITRLMYVRDWSGVYSALCSVLDVLWQHRQFTYASAILRRLSTMFTTIEMQRKKFWYHSFLVNEIGSHSEISSPFLTDPELENSNNNNNKNNQNNNNKNNLLSKDNSLSSNNNNNQNPESGSGSGKFAPIDRSFSSLNWQQLPPHLFTNSNDDNNNQQQQQEKNDGPLIFNAQNNPYNNTNNNNNNNTDSMYTNLSKDVIHQFYNSNHDLDLTLQQDTYLYGAKTLSIKFIIMLHFVTIYSPPLHAIALTQPISIHDRRLEFLKLRLMLNRFYQLHDWEKIFRLRIKLGTHLSVSGELLTRQETYNRYIQHQHQQMLIEQARGGNNNNKKDKKNKKTNSKQQVVDFNTTNPNNYFSSTNATGGSGGGAADGNDNLIEDDEDALLELGYGDEQQTQLASNGFGLGSYNPLKLMAGGLVGTVNLLASGGHLLYQGLKQGGNLLGITHKQRLTLNNQQFRGENMQSLYSLRPVLDASMLNKAILSVAVYDHICALTMSLIIGHSLKQNAQFPLFSTIALALLSPTIYYTNLQVFNYGVDSAAVNFDNKILQIEHDSRYQCKHCGLTWGLQGARFKNTLNNNNNNNNQQQQQHYLTHQQRIGNTNNNGVGQLQIQYEPASRSGTHNNRHTKRGSVGGGYHHHHHHSLQQQQPITNNNNTYTQLKMPQSLFPFALDSGDDDDDLEDGLLGDDAMYDDDDDNYSDSDTFDANPTPKKNNKNKLNNNGGNSRNNKSGSNNGTNNEQQQQQRQNPGTGIQLDAPPMFFNPADDMKKDISLLVTKMKVKQAEQSRLTQKHNANGMNSTTNGANNNSQLVANDTNLLQGGGNNGNKTLIQQGYNPQHVTPELKLKAQTSNDRDLRNPKIVLDQLRFLLDVFRLVRQGELALYPKLSNKANNNNNNNKTSNNNNNNGRYRDSIPDISSDTPQGRFTDIMKRSSSLQHLDDMLSNGSSNNNQQQMIDFAGQDADTHYLANLPDEGEEIVLLNEDILLSPEREDHFILYKYLPAWQRFPLWNPYRRLFFTFDCSTCKCTAPNNGNNNNKGSGSGNSSSLSTTVGSTSTTTTTTTTKKMIVKEYHQDGVREKIVDIPNTPAEQLQHKKRHITTTASSSSSSTAAGGGPNSTRNNNKLLAPSTTTRGGNNNNNNRLGYDDDDDDEDNDYFDGTIKAMLDRGCTPIIDVVIQHPRNILKRPVMPRLPVQIARKLVQFIERRQPLSPSCNILTALTYHLYFHALSSSDQHEKALYTASATLSSYTGLPFGQSVDKTIQSTLVSSCLEFLAESCTADRYQPGDASKFLIGATSLLNILTKSQYIPPLLENNLPQLFKRLTGGFSEVLQYIATDPSYTPDNYLAETDAKKTLKGTRDLSEGLKIAKQNDAVSKATAMYTAVTSIIGQQQSDSKNVWNDNNSTNTAGLSAQQRHANAVQRYTQYFTPLLTMLREFMAKYS